MNELFTMSIWIVKLSNDHIRRRNELFKNVDEMLNSVNTDQVCHLGAG